MSDERPWAYTQPGVDIARLRELDLQLREKARKAPSKDQHGIGMQRWGLSKSIGRNMDVNLYRRFKEHHYIATEYRDGLPHGICSCGRVFQVEVESEITREEFLKLPGHGDFSEFEKLHSTTDAQGDVRPCT